MMGQRLLTIPNLSAWLCFVWGIACLNPSSDLFAKNPLLFNAMLDLIPSEALWGVLWAACGIVGLALGLTGRVTWTARLMFAANTAFAMLYLISDYSQPGAYFFGSIAIANFILQGEHEWKRR